MCKPSICSSPFPSPVCSLALSMLCSSPSAASWGFSSSSVGFWAVSSSAGVSSSFSFSPSFGSSDACSGSLASSLGGISSGSACSTCILGWSSVPVPVSCLPFGSSSSSSSVVSSISKTGPDKQQIMVESQSEIFR